MNNFIGFNVDTINLTIRSINEYSTRLKNILNEIDETMKKINKSYDCESGKDLFDSYENLSNCFPVICSNMLSYKKDLQELKLRYSRESTILSDILAQKKAKVNANEK